VVRLLLIYGANVHAEDDYSLRWSAKNRHFDIVKLLLRYYSPNYILQHNLHERNNIHKHLEEYLVYRKRLILVQRLVLDWLWRPNGYYCNKNWKEIEKIKN
jgi:ankyrin repeat protein